MPASIWTGPGNPARGHVDFENRPPIRCSYQGLMDTEEVEEYWEGIRQYPDKVPESHPEPIVGDRVGFVPYNCTLLDRWFRAHIPADISVTTYLEGDELHMILRRYVGR